MACVYAVKSLVPSILSSPFIFIRRPRAAGISPVTVPSPPAEDAASCQGTQGSFLLRSPAGKALPRAGMLSVHRGCRWLRPPARGQGGS